MICYSGRTEFETLEEVKRRARIARTFTRYRSWQLSFHCPRQHWSLLFVGMVMFLLIWRVPPVVVWSSCLYKTLVTLSGAYVIIIIISYHCLFICLLSVLKGQHKL